MRIKKDGDTYGQKQIFPMKFKRNKSKKKKLKFKKKVKIELGKIS
jgi:hypothetical protein